MEAAQPPKSKGKRKRPSGDVLKEVYEEAIQSVVSRESTGRPGTPHRFFQSSWTVAFKESVSNKKTKSENEDRIDTQLYSDKPVVIHKHANELCIVTVGAAREMVERVEFLVKEAPEMSAGERRKRQGKMLQGKVVPDTVTPSTVLARLTLEDGSVELIRAGVWGTILELNHGVNATLLREDPLLDGYLAVILPTGPFPPRQFVTEESDDILGIQRGDETAP